MQSERWQTCVELFDAAMGQPRERRAEFIAQRCRGDPALQHGVEVLLTYHEKAGDFISTPAFEAAPELLASDPDELIGQRLGSYRVDAVLGKGGMGVVYLASDERLERKVALKLLPGTLVSNNGQLELLKREARAASALNHPNIVTIHEIGEADDTHFIATEFIEGVTLRQKISQGPLPPNEALEIAIQIAGALRVAHGAGIVHRDIKPENIMLRPDGYVKLLDFGIAKLMQSRRPAGLELVSHDEVIAGTTRYMSPEQASGHTVDARSDLWSLGVVLYEMLAGRAPFEGDTATVVLAAMFETNPQPIRHRARDISSALQAIVDTCLRKNPAERYQTAEELLSELRTIKEKAEGIAAKRARWIAVVAILALLLAFAFFYGWRDGRPERMGEPKTSDKSIAVLPFENLSKDEENAFFADGVQDEILSNLARVADLKVISRTSVMKYKTDSERNLREIGQQLGVAHVLEGSVQRIGNRVKVSAQLIDARTDTHEWSNTYDRDLNNVFAIQSEIAETIADQLKANLSPAEKAAISNRPTTDPLAYAYYTEAMAICGHTDWQGWEKYGQRAAELLEKATQRDPKFALAYCELAWIEAGLHNATWDLKHLELAKKAAETAVQLRPDLGETHLALAFYHFRAGFSSADRGMTQSVDTDSFDRAREELAIAKRKLPNDSDTLFIEARIDRRQNRWDSAVANLCKANDLDPQNGQVAFWLQDTYRYMRRYSDEERLLKKRLAFGEEEETWFDMLVAEIKLAQGDAAQAQSLLDQVPLDFSPNGQIWSFRFRAILYRRDFDAATRVLAGIPANRLDEYFEGRPQSLADGELARARGDKEKAAAVFAKLRQKLDTVWGDKRKDEAYFSRAAQLDAGLGRKEEAIREALRAVELMPIGRDSIAGTACVTNLALVYAWTGERDRALEQLELIATKPGAAPTYGDLLLNPCWDDLRGDKRFDKIVAAAKAASR